MFSSDEGKIFFSSGFPFFDFPRRSGRSIPLFLNPSYFYDPIFIILLLLLFFFSYLNFEFIPSRAAVYPYERQKRKEKYEITIRLLLFIVQPWINIEPFYSLDFLLLLICTQDEIDARKRIQIKSQTYSMAPLLRCGRNFGSSTSGPVFNKSCERKRF